MRGSSLACPKTTCSSFRCEETTVDKLSSRAYVREMVRQKGLHLSRRRGQNFLVDPNQLDRISEAAGLTSDDRVMEIGAGFGVLTALLSGDAGAVVAIESDRGIFEVLEENLGDAENVRLVLGDALKLDLVELLDSMKEHAHSTGPAPKVVSNLPYHITTPIIARLLEDVHPEHPIGTIVVMVQKEVAERVVAEPGTKAYGSFSVLVQYYSEPRIHGVVPATSFFPVPNVDSAILVLDMRPSPAISVPDRGCFFQVVRAAFAQRRKTLVNALAGAGGFGLAKRQLDAAIRSAGLDPGVRGERLSLVEFARVAEAVSEQRCREE